MIDINFFFALVSFYFVMYVTPGPNNTMVLASGLKFGFSKTVPVIFGITIGHIIQLVLVCLGLWKLFQVYPQLQFLLKIGCAVYMSYLSFKIIGSFGKFEVNNTRPIKIYEAALFQIVNPKAWTISSMAASGFISNEMNLIGSVSIIAFVALLVCPLSISPWAGFGSAIRSFVKKHRIRLAIEYLLAALLLITAALILADTKISDSLIFTLNS